MRIKCPLCGERNLREFYYQGADVALRSWGGIMDMSPDGSPIIAKTHIGGLFLNAGWDFAHLMATGSPHQTAEKYMLERFRTGHLIDEEGTGAQHNLH